MNDLALKNQQYVYDPHCCKSSNKEMRLVYNMGDQDTRDIDPEIQVDIHLKELKETSTSGTTPTASVVTSRRNASAS